MIPALTAACKRRCPLITSYSSVFSIGRTISGERIRLRLYAFDQGIHFLIVLDLEWVSGKGVQFFCRNCHRLFHRIFHFISLFLCILHGLFSPARALALIIHTNAETSPKFSPHGEAFLEQASFVC